VGDTIEVNYDHLNDGTMDDDGSSYANDLASKDVVRC
jgi:hypothetical protein